MRSSWPEGTNKEQQKFLVSRTRAFQDFKWTGRPASSPLSLAPRGGDEMRGW